MVVRVVLFIFFEICSSTTYEIKNNPPSPFLICVCVNCDAVRYPYCAKAHSTRPTDQNSIQFISIHFNSTHLLRDQSDSVMANRRPDSGSHSDQSGNIDVRPDQLQFSCSKILRTNFVSFFVPISARGTCCIQVFRGRIELGLVEFVGKSALQILSVVIIPVSHCVCLCVYLYINFRRRMLPDS